MLETGLWVKTNIQDGEGDEYPCQMPIAIQNLNIFLFIYGLRYFPFSHYPIQLSFWTDRQTDRPTDPQTNRPTDQQTNRLTDWQIDRPTDRQTKSHVNIMWKTQEWSQRICLNLRVINGIYIPITGQSIQIPYSELFSHLRCRNGSQTFESLYLHITSDLIELYISDT